MIDAVIEELKTHQTQLDQDGVMVGVSRQALEELLAHFAAPAHPAPIAGLEPVAWRFTARDAYAVTMERAWATARGKNVSALVTIEQAQAYAAAQVAGAVAKEREACLLAIADVDQALIDAADYFDNRADVNDGDYGLPEPNTEMRLASQCNEAIDGGSPNCARSGMHSGARTPKNAEAAQANRGGLECSSYAWQVRRCLYAFCRVESQENSDRRGWLDKISAIRARGQS